MIEMKGCEYELCDFCMWFKKLTLCAIDSTDTEAWMSCNKDRFICRLCTEEMLEQWSAL